MWRWRPNSVVSRGHASSLADSLNQAGEGSAQDEALTGLFGRRADDTDCASQAVGGAAQWGQQSAVGSHPEAPERRADGHGGGGILQCVVENLVLHSI